MQRLSSRGALDQRGAGRRLRSAALFLLFAVLVAHPVAAHPFLDDRLASLDERIADDPGNARLLLSRGRLLLDAGHPAEALAELDRAVDRDGTLAEAHLLRAEALHAARYEARALDEARLYLQLEPRSPRGWLVAARAEGAGGNLGAAIDLFDSYLELAADPRADDYLERAQLAQRAGRPDDAVRGLEAGVARRGPLTSLLRAALEIERGRGELAKALAWADRLAGASPQLERWQLERARLLRDLGRPAEARDALSAAASALAGRSEAKRSAQAFRALAREIARLGSELDASAGGNESP